MQDRLALADVSQVVQELLFLECVTVLGRIEDQRYEAIHVPVACFVHKKVEAMLVLVVKSEHQVPVIPGILSWRKPLPENLAFPKPILNADHAMIPLFHL
jgi:hypothetical protein